MKPHPVQFLSACLAGLALLFATAGQSQTVSNFTSVGTFTWVCPNGVHTVQVQAWGGGGAGGSARKATANATGGGGGGGAYAASNSVSVTPGNSYTVFVGGGGAATTTTLAANGTAAPGTNSWFGTATVTNCLAVGGNGGADAYNSYDTAYGTGGAVAGCIGTVLYAGGNGAGGSSSHYSGGGGSGAGTTAAGGNASSYNGGTSAAGGGSGGAGVNGAVNGAGGAGSAPGGGGGGSSQYNTGQNTGGAGAAGRVSLTYSVSYGYVAIESAADGTGTNLTAQSLAAGNSITCYAIARETNGAFIANVPATWAVTNATGNVAGTDLVPAANNQSAVFTAHLAGAAKIVAYFGTVPANPSGLITVVSSGTTAVWAVDANGNWTTAANWSSNPTVPGTAGDSVILGTGSALRSVTLTANESVGTISFTNPNSFVIAGPSKLTLDNAGKGANLAVNAGSANAILTPVSFNDNVAAVISGGQTLTCSNSLTSTGTQTLTVGGAGTLNLQANSTFGPAAGTVGTTINGGTISFGQNEPLGAGDLSITANNTLQATASGLILSNNLLVASGVTSTVNNGGNTLTLNGVIGGSGNLALTGSGTTILNGVNNYAGTTTVSAGTLSLATAGALGGGGAVILNGGDLLGNGTLTLPNNVNIGPASGSVGATAYVDVASGQQLSLGGIIASAGNTGTNAVWVNTHAGSTGTLVLSGANTFSGGLVVSNGNVNFSAANNLGSGPISLPGGTLTGTAGATTLVTLGNTISVPTNTVGTINSSPRMSFTPFGGGGTLNLNVGGTILQYTRFQSAGWGNFTGTLNITGTNVGTVAPVEGYFNGGSFDGNLGNAVVNLTNAQFSTFGNSYANTVTFGALSGDANSALSSSDNAGYPIYAIGGLNLSTTFAGTMKNGISGAPCLNKVGTGTLTLSGTSTATGWIQVNGGTLNVIGTLGNVAITNYAGTTLTGNGGTIGGTVDLKPGSTLTPQVGGFGSISLNGLTMEGGTNVFYVSTTNVSTVAMSGYPLAMISGTVQVVTTQTLPNGSYTLISYGYETGGSVANLSLVGFSQPNQVAYLQDTGSQIQLVVATRSAANLTWLGSGSAQNNIWDVSTSLNWTDGTNSNLGFSPGDSVTFNNNGAGNTTVDLKSVVQPSAVTVTGNNAWVFESSTGTGSINGTNALVTSGSGSLTVETVNSYSGGTTVGSGYTVTVGNGAAASLGTGPITDNGTLIYNQNNSQTLAGVSGSGSLAVNGTGTVTVNGSYAYTGGTTIGTGATLQLGTGTNVASGSLVGAVTDNGTLTLDLTGALTVTNVSGSGTFIQEGSSVLTLGGSNAWQQNTYISGGTVKLASSTAIPSSTTVTGSTGWLILDGGATAAGTLDLAGYDAAANALSGASGTVKGLITNSSSATTTNTLVIGGTYGGLNTTYAGLINENSAGAKIALSFQGGNTNYLTQANSYSGGTTVGAGNYLYLSTASSAGSGPITLNNGAEVGCTTASIYFGNNFIIAPGAAATLYSSQLSANFNGPFTFAAANSTNIISGYVSLGAATSCQFGTTTGTVVIPSGATLRFASTSLQLNGGSNTTFDVEGSIYTRNGNFVAGEGLVLGALTGAGSLSGGDTSGSVGTTYVVGSANKSTTFTGTINDGRVGNTALIKVGTGSLTLTQPLVYSGNTAINGGALVLGSGVDPTNSATLSLASGTLDVASMGDGTVTLGAARNQTLSGTGTINGSLVAQANSVFSPALGTVTVTSGTVTLAGTNNFVLNRTNAANCSELVSTNLTASGVLTVVNNGPALQSGDTFQLFSQGVSGFSTVTLPTLTSPLYWSNTIASNGAITVAGTVTPPVSYIAFTGAPVISGTSLSISVTNSGGGNLYLLTTTNLANAVSTWKPIWTNSVSGSGRFTTNLLNAVNPAYSQQFFLMSTNN